MFMIINFVSLRDTISINKSDKCKISVIMDWNIYYKEQINDFTGNQTGGFIRPLGKFLWKQNAKLHPEEVVKHVNLDHFVRDTMLSLTLIGLQKRAESAGQRGLIRAPPRPFATK